MDVVGERILIFGDSLTHHGADAAPEIWDVDVGSGRASSAPGDLLASMLLEQGAQAVRTNANVGRSAHNFWAGNARRQLHSAQELIASDQAWGPTKVIVMLGTNDADSGAINADAMAAIRDAYAAMGAEVWAIGPPVFVDPTLSAKADRAFAMMSDVFGDRLIDARPLSSTVGRAGDGVHFQPVAAQQFALQLASALATTRSSVWNRKPWLGAALGVAIFGTLGYLIWGSYRSGQLGGHDEDEDDLLPGGKAEGMSPDDFDPRQLKAGIKVELEHTNDPAIAQEIARDHLAEDPDYYIKLKSIHLDGLMHMVDGKKWTRGHSPAAAGYREIACKAGIPDLHCWSSPKQLKGPSQPSHYQKQKPPAEKIPAYFVDPETGDVVEVDQRTAKYRREGETEFRGPALDRAEIATKNLAKAQKKYNHHRQMFMRGDRGYERLMYKAQDELEARQAEYKAARAAYHDAKATGVGGADDEDEDGATFWLGMLKRKQTTVSELQDEIAESKQAIAKRSKKKPPAKTAPDRAYAQHCQMIEHHWKQLRMREEAIAKFLKKPDPQTPRPDVCPTPMVFEHWGKDRPKTTPEDDDYGWDRKLPKPAGYDERRQQIDEHDRLSDEEYKVYKARGLWGAASFSDVRKQLKRLGVDEMISERDNEIHVGKIVVPKGSRGAGTGTQAMQLLVDYADQTGKRIVLTPSTDFGASSVARLKTFYKRFGFVENKGRNKDWTTRETMIRPPIVRSKKEKKELPVCQQCGSRIGVRYSRSATRGGYYCPSHFPSLRGLGVITYTKYTDDDSIPFSERLKDVKVTAKEKANRILMDQLAKRGYWSESDDSYQKMTARERVQVEEQLEKQATRLAKLLGFNSSPSG
jgi:lysophospholipase L1-like esterase/GNAT superfamily N-acetyltransferase